MSRRPLRRRRRDVDRYVTAKDLAEMGFCEQRVLLAHRLGNRVTHEQQADQQRGRRAHQRYFEIGTAARVGDDRCFIASAVFGSDAPETALLRAYRDRVLLPRPWGRAVVAMYYATAPRVCRALLRAPRLCAAVRLLLRWVARHCARSLEEGLR